MSETHFALINHQVVRWARERLGESLETFAAKARIPAHRLAEWEKGKVHPKFRQAQHLAHALAVPFGSLFLSTLPSSQSPLPDLRTLATVGKREPSPDFLELLYAVALKQEWYRDYLEAEKSAPLEFVGRFEITSPVHLVAADIRETLNITDSLRAECRSWEDFLSTLIERSESAGILVLRSGIVGSNTRRKLAVHEFRGFAISDELAPLVFINSRDAKAAQIFTLIHELAHIWVDQSGISNPNYRKKASQQGHVVERFCNSVAGEVLLPKAKFLIGWRENEFVEDNLKRLSVQFRVSTVAVLRQAYELNRITEQEYRDLFRKEKEKWTTRKEPQGGDFYLLLRARNGKLLTEAVTRSALGGRMLKRDAARLLSVKVHTLSKISEKLYGEK